MTWGEIITLSRRRLQETTEKFFGTDILKQYGIEAQREVARRVPRMFDVTRTFSTVATQADYTLAAYPGPDVHELRLLSTPSYPQGLVNVSEENFIRPIQSGTPALWAQRGLTVVLHPTPSAIAVVTTFGGRLPPRYALSIIHDGGASATAATVAIASNSMSLVITGGTNAGTTTYSLTAAAYDTLAELAAVINALAIGWTATVSGDVRGAEASSLLEALATTSCFQTTLNLYENPEVWPMFHENLKEYICYLAWLESGEDNFARPHVEKWEQAIQSMKDRVDTAVKGRVNRQITNAYDGGGRGNSVYRSITNL